MPQLHPRIVLEGFAVSREFTGLVGSFRLLEDCGIGDFHMVFGEGSSLVGTENVDTSECFDGAETFAEDFVLLHCVGDDGERGRYRDWKA